MKKFDLKMTKRKLKELSMPTEVIRYAEEGYYIGDYYKRVEIMADRMRRVRLLRAKRTINLWAFQQEYTDLIKCVGAYFLKRLV